MIQRFQHRAGHYALLTAVTAGLCFVRLGAPSLWDIDEGHNAEAAREMLVSGNGVVPTFNYRLRPDKPALLYWLQVGAYRAFGVNEAAVRLPSALAAWATVLLVYELGRRMFGAATGLLAGLILASTVMFCAAAHFANPDALLLACTTAALGVFWNSYPSGGRSWFVPAAACSGLAVLAKGPVGLVLPSAVVGLFLLWAGALRRLWDRRLLAAALAFAVVAVPWYVWVGAETKGEFLRGFLWTHNAGRFRAPMEGHGGPAFYYLLCLAVGFAPWSVFFVPALGYALGRRARADAPDAPASALPDAYRFLWCWVGVYLLFFSASATKLPNYVLPVYPPLAVLTARFLDRWRRRAVAPPAWLMPATLAGLALIGVGVAAGLVVAGGAVEVPWLRGRRLPGLENWAVAGVLPVLGAAAAGWSLWRQRRSGTIGWFAASAALFVGVLAAGGSLAVDAHKSARPLARALPEDRTAREVRVGCYGYYQPSLVFYCRREVCRFGHEAEAIEFLRYPVPVYLFVPAPVWAALEPRATGPHRVLARHADLYLGTEVVVVTNE